MTHTHFMTRRRLQPIWRERDGMVGPNGLIGVPLRGKRMKRLAAAPTYRRCIRGDVAF